MLQPFPATQNRSISVAKTCASPNVSFLTSWCSVRWTVSTGANVNAPVEVSCVRTRSPARIARAGCSPVSVQTDVSAPSAGRMARFSTGACEDSDLLFSLVGDADVYDATSAVHHFAQPLRSGPWFSMSDVSSAAVARSLT